MKKQSHEMKHCQLMNAVNKARHESELWINQNQCLVEFPPLSLYLSNSDTRVWVENDTLIGLRFIEWEYRFAKCPPSEAVRIGYTRELSAQSVAVLRDHMDEHWNDPASKRIRAARESILGLTSGSAGEHPTVKAITDAARRI